MDPQYQALHQTAEKLWYRLQDICEDRNQPLAQTLMQQTKDVADHIAANKAPRDIEDRIYTVEKSLEQTRQLQGAVLNDNNYNEMHGDYERLRSQIRQLPTY